MIKVYEAVRQNAARLVTKYCGVCVELNFINGNLFRGRNAELSTNDKFIQDAIENDPRFGVSIRLAHTYAEPSDTAGRVLPGGKVDMPAKKDNQPKRARRKAADTENYDMEQVEEVTDINGVIAFFERKGEQVSSEEDIEALKEKYNVVFPNIK